MRHTCSAVAIARHQRPAGADGRPCAVARRSEPGHVRLLENGVDVTALHNHFFWDGRNDLKVSEMGATINARMGLNTWAAFTGTNEKAAIADRPMIIFLHYWGTGSAETLATGFKAALNELGKHAGASR